MEALRELLDELMSALAPLIDSVAEPERLQALLANLGWTTASVPQPIRDLATVGSEIISLAGEDPESIDGSRVLNAIVVLVKAINEIATHPDSSFPSDVDIAAFKNTIARDLLDFLLVDYLTRRRLPVGAAMKLAGLIRIVDTPLSGLRQAYRKREVMWSRIGELFADPVKGFHDAFEWESTAPRIHEALSELAAVLEGSGATLTFFEPGGDLLGFIGADATSTVPLIGADLEIFASRGPNVDLAVGLQALARPAASPTGPALILLPYARLGDATDIALTDTLSLTVGGGAEFSKGLAIVLSPGSGIQVKSDFLGGIVKNAPGLKLGLMLSPSPDEPERILLGAEDATRLAIKRTGVALSGKLLGADKFDLSIELKLEAAHIVIKPSPEDADSFLGKILGENGIGAEFSLGVRLSSVSGFSFTGSGGLEVQLPLHVSLGPIDFQAITLGLKPNTQGMNIEAGATVSGKLGPLAFVVEQAGFALVAKFPNPPQGNLGPLDLGFRFKPPKGVGLSIDASVVKGGGYLYFDFDNEEYAGALELKLADFLDLKAIGLITTKMPDGTKGFSLLVIITAEFSPGLQLGYGFKLIGVGGLLGLNRTMVLEAIAQGVRTGGVNEILFPADPVANAPRIISDLRSFFPPALNRFLIGPMGKLGWGTPTVISLELGIVIEIPGNLALLGVLELALGSDDSDEPVLLLKVSFIGAIEFDKKRGWFFASLFDSRLLTITIDGEMGVLIAVGDQPNFLISNGGFHPQFTPPPLPFPSPRRISFNIIDTDYARIRVEGYFAVTTNTVQTGARAELHLGFDAISIDGHFGFDALVHFPPFYFIVEVTATVSLKVGGVGVFSIDLDLALAGTTPWHARGRASLSLLFIKVSKDFDETWGQTVDTTLPPVEVAPLLKAELGKASNWRALPPPSHQSSVTMRKLDLPDGTIVVHPFGALEISQNMVPLGITVDTFGLQTPSDADRFAAKVTSSGLTKLADARRSFAPAQFKKMSDAEKLSAPAFEDDVSGLVIGVDGAPLRSGRAVRRTVRHQLVIIDTHYKRATVRFRTLGQILFDHFIKNAAVSKSTLSVTRRRQTQPFADGVKVAGERFAVVSTNDNTPAAVDSADFATRGAAREWMSRACAKDPSLAERVHIVPVTEMSAAA